LNVQTCEEQIGEFAAIACGGLDTQFDGRSAARRLRLGGALPRDGGCIGERGSAALIRAAHHGEALVKRRLRGAGDQLAALTRLARWLTVGARTHPP
jgi:hypothetical protein